MAEAAEGTLVPTEVPDQAGAVRDLVAALKRSPTSETRTADLVPRAWIPVLVAALLLARVHASRARGRRWSAWRACCSLAGTAAAQRPTAGERALAAGDPAARGRRVPQGARARAPRATPPSTTPAPRRSRPGGSTSRAARWPRPPSRSTPGCATARSTISASVDCSPPRPTRLAQDELLGRRGGPPAPGAAAAAVLRARQVEPRAGRAAPSAAATAVAAEAGGGTPPPSGGGGHSSRSPSRPEPQSRDLTQSQAEQILNSMERRERETREEQQRRLQAGSPAE